MAAAAAESDAARATRLLCSPASAAEPASAAAAIARQLTCLPSWPCAAFGALYDALAQRGWLHELLLHSSQPVPLLAHVLACGAGGGARLAAVVAAVAGRPSEPAVLALCAELQLAHRQRAGGGGGGAAAAERCPAEWLRANARAAGDARQRRASADFARKLDERLRTAEGYDERPMAQLLEALQRGAAAPSHARRLAIDEVCRRCCCEGDARLTAVSAATLSELLRHCGWSEAPSGAQLPLPPSAVAVMHAFLCRGADGGGGHDSAASREAASPLAKYDGLLPDFVRGVAASARSHWRQQQHPSATGRGLRASSPAATFRHAASIARLLQTAAGVRAVSRVLGCEAPAAGSDAGEPAGLSWLALTGGDEAGRLDAATADRLAHFWLLLVSRDDRAGSSLWDATLGAHAVGASAGACGDATAAALRALLTDILRGLRWRNLPSTGKRGRSDEEDTHDDPSLRERAAGNAPLLHCLHAVCALCRLSMARLPNLYADAPALCRALLGVFDGVAQDVPQMGRMGRLKLLRAPFMDCAVEVLESVHEISMLGPDGVAGSVWKHHQDFMSQRGNDDGVPMPLFAAAAGQIAKRMCAQGEELRSMPEATSRKLWQLFGEVVVRVRQWSGSRDKDAPAFSDISSQTLNESLLVLPAQGLMQQHAGGDDEPVQKWHGLIVSELIVLVRAELATVRGDALVAALTALRHLVAPPELGQVSLWTAPEPDAAAQNSDTSDAPNGASPALQIVKVCTEVLSAQLRSDAAQDGRGAVAARVIADLLAAAAKASSDMSQLRCTEAMLHLFQHDDAAVAALLDGIVDSAPGGLAAECARCVQLMVGAHDSLVEALLAEELQFLPRLLRWGTSLSSARADPGELLAATAALAGLLTLCVERAPAQFWGQVARDARFFELVRSLLDVILSARNKAPGDALPQAARHTMRFVGNVVDAVAAKAQLAAVGVPRRLEEMASRRVGLSAHAAARVGQMARAISA